MAEKTNVGISVFVVDRTNFSDKDDGITRWGKNKARPWAHTYCSYSWWYDDRRCEKDHTQIIHYRVLGYTEENFGQGGEGHQTEKQNSRLQIRTE